MEQHLARQAVHTPHTTHQAPSTKHHTPRCKQAVPLGASTARHTACIILLGLPTSVSRRPSQHVPQSCPRPCSSLPCSTGHPAGRRPDCRCAAWLPVRVVKHQSTEQLPRCSAVDKTCPTGQPAAHTPPPLSPPPPSPYPDVADFHAPVAAPAPALPQPLYCCTNSASCLHAWYVSSSCWISASITSSSCMSAPGPQPQLDVRASCTMALMVSMGWAPG
jgi:hypothetical protein